VTANLLQHEDENILKFYICSAASFTGCAKLVANWQLIKLMLEILIKNLQNNAWKNKSRKKEFTAAEKIVELWGKLEKMQMQGKAAKRNRAQSEGNCLADWCYLVFFNFFSTAGSKNIARTMI
jgi:hypothetical protein